MPRKFTIGREKTCDFPVTDESVSRLHAEIWLSDEGALTVADHGSSNGTSLIRSGATLPLLQTNVQLTDELKFGAAVVKVKDVVDAIEAQNPGALTPKSSPPPLPPPSPVTISTASAPRPAVPPSTPPPVAAPPPPIVKAAPPPPPPVSAPPPVMAPVVVPPPMAAPPPVVVAAPPPPPVAVAPPPKPPEPPPTPPKVEPAPPPPPVRAAEPPPMAAAAAAPADAGPSPLLPAAPPQIKVNPVVGWLVCLEGPDHGRDYPLRAGNNSLGRSPVMEVCIANDAAVSREKHCVVSFDPARETFLLSPSEGTHLLYLNGESIRSPRHLTRDDVIDVGRTKLVFIPFCDGKYRWNA